MESKDRRRPECVACERTGVHTEEKTHLLIDNDKTIDINIKNDKNDEQKQIITYSPIASPGFGNNITIENTSPNSSQSILSNGSYKTGDNNTKLNFQQNLFDQHIHKKILPSLFINYWFRYLLINNNKIKVIPNSIIYIISNYVIKQNISSILYINNNET